MFNLDNLEGFTIKKALMRLTRKGFFVSNV